MTILIPPNPLQAVQFIPIFSYLNILSDFLFIENYLAEVDQTKKIPIVNALYKYLGDHDNNESMKVKLIRSLLKRSDLYGEKSNEEPDVIFVNAMFDYIISSLVFEKYGNIYGFLTEVFRIAENLEIDYILNLTRKHLQDALFENEYGDRSILSSLSVKRIYNDIILALFPRPTKNFTLSSLDYIYAQAGLMFLRLGTPNTVYYRDLKHSNLIKLDHDKQFDEYLIAGHLSEKLLLINEKKNFHLLKFFALPALSNYIFNNKYLYAYDYVANLISEARFWRLAFKDLFRYTFNVIKKTKNKLNNDNNFNLHTAFSTFLSRSTSAKILIDHYCTNISTDSNTLLVAYLNSPDTFQCKFGENLPNLNNLYMDQVEEIVKLYKIRDLQLVKTAFGESLIEYIEQTEVTIKLLYPHSNIAQNDSSNSKRLPFDLLQISYPNQTFNYYALVRENHNLILLNNAMNPQLFEEKIGLNVDYLKLVVSIILKTPKQDVNKFMENLMEYKTEKLKQYLHHLDTYKENEESWKIEWWKEFGLNLVPYYPCLFDKFGENFEKDICPVSNIKFFNKYHEEITLNMIDINTQNLLSLLGTTIGSLFLEIVCQETAHDFIILQKEYTRNNSNTLQEEYRISLINALNRHDEIFNVISLHIEDPAFAFNFITKDDINLLEKIINALEEKTNFNLTFIKNTIYVMKTINSNPIRNILNGKIPIYVNIVNNETYTGYGYKFTFLSENLRERAYLRTDYEFRNKKLTLLIDEFSENGKKYIRINSETLRPEFNSIMYEFNNQVRSKANNVSFSGITMYHDDENCENSTYLLYSRYIHVCLRHWSLNTKLDFVNSFVEYVQVRTNHTEEQIYATLNKYIFPDNTTLKWFSDNWIVNRRIEEPSWGKNFLINNPQLFNKLRYDTRLENHRIYDSDGIFRINALYTYRERHIIEKGTSIENIIKNYHDQKAYFSATFEDYYAIRNYATTGYKRINSNTNEAKLMKLALYNLAIRQSGEEFELRLFRVESKSIYGENNLFLNKTITLQKFTLASTDLESAKRFFVHPEDGFINVVYEMVFDGPYIRGKIDQLYERKEKKAILLPGSEFLLTNIRTEGIEGLGTVLKLKLQYKHDTMDKYTWYKKIMAEREKIKF
ncbi:uncharacterized protein LOC127286791 [Leptopilina boulardi]|uniref:uncharacterized protein LOC127286791 n=1 Tax=Leptopilina boulardi TaxID=63433 RepID=UPI0021F5A6BE|nr:uncharacterized protein LOC127286791 [Leptopilina boulardi]